MVASAPSVARLADALLRGSLLTPASRKQMFTTVPADTAYFSYGLGIGQTFSTRLFKNVWTTYGAFPGFGSTLRYLPGRNVTVVVLANGDNTTLLTADIADLLLQTATEPAGSG
jgi:CubicO group peptidase (beta-lactamase class C family)